MECGVISLKDWTSWSCLPQSSHCFLKLPWGEEGKEAGNSDPGAFDSPGECACVCVPAHTCSQSVSPGSGLFSSLQTEDPMARLLLTDEFFLLTKQTDQE